MSDSSNNNELFGDEDNESDNMDLFEPGMAQPEYTETEEFNKFVKDQDISIHDKYGYVFIHTYKPFYFPGEIVRGSIVLDLFNDLPKKCKNINIRFSGREMVGKYFENVKSSLKSQQQ